jgi:uncharacterized membrane protein YidH (DUF202 family)
MTGPTPFDLGVQPERTGLAWRRTTITLAATALITLRLRPTVLGPWGLGVGLLVLLAACVLWVLGERRFRRVRRVLRTSSGLLPDSRLLLAIAVIVAAAAAFGLVSLFVVR